MAFVTLEDEALPIELIVFPRVYETARPFLTHGSPIAVKGRVQIGDEDEEQTVSLIASTVEPLSGSTGRAAEYGSADDAPTVNSSQADNSPANNKQNNSSQACAAAEAVKGAPQEEASPGGAQSKSADRAAQKTVSAVGSSGVSSSATGCCGPSGGCIRLYVRVPDMNCTQYRHAENLFSIFELERGASGARVTVYDSSDGSYHPRSGGDVALGTVLLGELKELLGEENVVLRRARE